MGRQFGSGGAQAFGLMVFFILGQVPSIAHACSGGTSGIFGRQIIPGDGAVGVPLNGQIEVTYTAQASGPFWSTGLQIRPQNGQPLAADVQQVYAGRSSAKFVLRPSTALAANTVYEILDSLIVPCMQSECQQVAPHVVASLTTGSRVDSVPPSFAGLASIEVSPTSPYDAPCAQGSAFHVTLHWEAATDDLSPTVTYTVYNANANGSVRIQSFLSGTSLTGIVTCPVCLVDFPVCPSTGVSPYGEPFSGDGFAQSVGPFIVRAVDEAGNEDTNVAVIALPSLCPGSRGVDAGAPDLGPPPDAEAAEAAPDTEPASDAEDSSDVVLDIPEDMLEDVPRDASDAVSDAGANPPPTLDAQPAAGTCRGTSCNVDSAGATGCPGLGVCVAVAAALLLCSRRQLRVGIRREQADDPSRPVSLGVDAISTTRHSPSPLERG
jgi:hypothetical protein